MSDIKVPSDAFRLPRDYEGYIFVSDIDKTYLATEFDSLWGLLKTAFETAERKSNIAGFSILLRAVRRGAQEQPAEKPLFFISASPPQMENTISAKMELDGVEHNGIIFKNQFRHVREGKFKKLKEQIGYKLLALLTLWQHLPVKSKLVLFGDDSESDAVVYSMFSDIMSDRISGRPLYKLLLALKVFREDALKIAWKSRRFKKQGNPVQGVFINLVTNTQPMNYSKFGPHFFPTENTLQAALALLHMGLIRLQAVVSIGRDLLIHHDFQSHQLMDSLLMGARRGLYPLSVVDDVWPELHKVRVLPAPEGRRKDEGAVSEYMPVIGGGPQKNQSDAVSDVEKMLTRRYLD